MLIEVRGIDKTYPDSTHALRGASFDIDNGEFVAIMGPSGSGKSTLLHILGFLDRATSGTYRFDGRTIDDYSENELAHIRNKDMGFVFQTFNLLPRATVLENVKLPLLYSKVPQAKWNTRAENAIASVKLEHRTHHDSTKLSGGEKQRAAIARALVNDAKLIFADEPTGNLDSKSGAAVMSVIQKLNEQGATVILITHETHTAQHAKRIISFRDGAIVSDEKVTTRRNSQKGLLK